MSDALQRLYEQSGSPYGGNADRESVLSWAAAQVESRREMLALLGRWHKAYEDDIGPDGALVVETEEMLESG